MLRRRLFHVRKSALLGKGTHARRTFRPAFRGIIVLDRRQPRPKGTGLGRPDSMMSGQPACVLCLAKNAPERPAGLRVFPEHGRQMTRQTRQMGRRPSTRITQPAAVQARKNHVCPCQLTLVLHDIGAGQHGIQRVKVLRRKFPQEQAFRFKLHRFAPTSRKR